MTNPPRPPRPSRLSTFILRAVTSRERANAVLGDIEEDLERAAAEGHGAGGRLAAERQAWSYVLAETRASVAIGLRSAGFVLRDAVRSIRSAPGAALFMLVILTAGIGAATVTFSVVDAVVLRPLPFSGASRLVAIHSQEPGRPGRVYGGLSSLEFTTLRARVTAVEDLTAVWLRADVLMDAADDRPIISTRVSASMFDALGVQPLLGRTFTAAHEVPGHDLITVIGYDLWQRRFHGDPAVIGRTISVRRSTYDGARTEPITVIGVMPPGFAYPIERDLRPEMWSPFVVPDDERAGAPQMGRRYLDVFGRLRAGDDIATAQAQIDAALASATDELRGLAGVRLVVRRLDEVLFGPIRGWMLLALTAVALVMLVTCANVANLMLSRAARRARELSIRASIGASRTHIVSVLLAESLMLSLLAAAIGLVVALWGVEAARAALPAGITRARDVAVDWRVLSAAVTAAIVTGLAFGAAPAWQAARADLVALLKTGAGSVIGSRSRWRAIFLGAQVAFVGVLLVVTTMVVASFVRLTTADLGFDRAGLVEIKTDRLAGQPADVLRELRAVPGVAAAGALAASDAPLIGAGFGGGASWTEFRQADGPADAPILRVLYHRVSPGYFDAVGIAVLRGRVFEDADLGRRDLIVIDELAARAVFGDREPVGARVALSAGSAATVIGVVRHVRMNGPTRENDPQSYFPAATGAGHRYLVRTTTPAGPLLPALSAAFTRALPAGSGEIRIRLVEDAFRNITADRRFAAGLLSIFGGLAMIIGGVGIYAVMASVVAQQTREIGIRMALGARAAMVVGRVLRQTARSLAAGLLVGLPAGWALSRVFTTLLFEVRPGDGLVYLIVIAIVGIVGLLAALVPARRAARVDPLIALRSE